jgi:hypothetical protein
MPLISDLINARKEENKRFQKNTYRPWDDELFSNNKERKDEKKSEELDPDPGHDVVESAKKLIDIPENSTSAEFSSENVRNDSLEKTFRDLFGAQKAILRYLFQCVEENNSEHIITKTISINELSSKCNLLPNTSKGTLQKLKNKKLLATNDNKPGRGGYARYKITKEIYEYLKGRL